MSYFQKLALILLLLFHPVSAWSQEANKEISSFRDLPIKVRNQVQREAKRYKKRARSLSGRVQLGHLFLCAPYCMKKGHFYLAKDKRSREGVQLKLSENFAYTRSKQLRFVPRQSNVYLVFKNDRQGFAETGEATQEAEFKPVVLSQGDDSEVFRQVESEYLLPFQKDRWGIYTSLQTLFSDRAVTTEKGIGAGWATPWSIYLKPRVEVISGLEFSAIRTLIGLDYTFSPLGEGSGLSAGALNSSVFGIDTSFLYRLSSRTLVGLTFRYDKTLFSMSGPDPQTFTSSSEILWIGLRAQFLWFTAIASYGSPLSLTDRVDIYRGTPEIESALAAEMKFCPYSFRLWSFQAFPCGYVGYRIENQFGPGGNSSPVYESPSNTTIRNISGGVTLELGNHF